MTSYQPESWHDLFVASAGAAAALTGLIFVAVSINLGQILADRRLPIRAGETLSVLLGLLLLSVLILVPGQARALLGSEIGALGALLAGFLVPRRLRLPREADEPLEWSLVPLLVILGTLGAVRDPAATVRPPGSTPRCGRAPASAARNWPGRPARRPGRPRLSAGPRTRR